MSNPHIWKLFGEGSQDGIDRSLLCTTRLQSIAECLAEVDGLEGDTAEIGAANGGTSKLIAMRKPERLHWACDTFEGLKDVGDEDPVLENGMFFNPLTGLPSFESVKEFLSPLENVRVVQGYFPECAPEEMKQRRFSFVHLDVDTYKSTLASFNFFADRVVPEGLIAIDDVAGQKALVGVRRAWKQLLRRGWTFVREARQQVVMKRDRA